MDKKAHILVVDDEEYICTIVRNMLVTNKDYIVTGCTDPEEALNLIENERVDLILTDLVMGEYSGVDILKACLKHQPESIVVFMTGHPTIENAISVLKLGAYDYLVKPFKLESLKASVMRGLEKLFLHRENIHLKNIVSLYQISEAMGSTIHLDSLLKLVLDSVMGEFDVSMSTIALLGRDSSELELRVYRGNLEEIKQIPFLTGNTPYNTKVVESGRPEIVNDLQIGDGVTSISPKNSAVCQPLFAKGKVIGILNIIRDGEIHPFTLGDLQSLSIIASKASSAIENSQLYDELEDAYLATITALANAVEARDVYTRGHTERVTHLAEILARALDWSDEELKWLRIGGTLHDIGKIGVPDCVLNKPGPLDPEELKIMQQHPEMGAKILIGIPFLEPILPYVLSHHERWDGTGYPIGLKEKEISIKGRLLAIADTVDAILSNRPYRKANTPENAIEELRLYKGVQFDPELVDVFLELWETNKLDLESIYSGRFNEAEKGFTEKKSTISRV